MLPEGDLVPPFFVVEESEYEAIRKLIELFVRNYLFQYCLIQSSLIPRLLLPCQKKIIIILQGRSLGMMLRSKINESHFLVALMGGYFGMLYNPNKGSGCILPENYTHCQIHS